MSKGPLITNLSPAQERFVLAVCGSVLLTGLAIVAAAGAAAWSLFKFLVG